MPMFKPSILENAYRSIFMVLLLLISRLTYTAATGTFQVKLASLETKLQVNSNSTISKAISKINKRLGGCNIVTEICFSHFYPLPPCLGYAKEAINCERNLSSIKLIRNKNINIPFNFSWQGALVMTLDVYVQKKTQKRLLVSVREESHVIPNKQWTNETMIENGTSLHWSYRVQCERHYFGNSCNTYCNPRNDVFGHYSCNKNGQRMCYDGWQGDYCSLAVCVPSCVHGACIKPQQCSCKRGWYGRKCSQCIPHQKCLHGHCNSSGGCHCFKGWAGKNCNQAVAHCSDKTCHGNGQCEIKDNKSMCHCHRGFSGSFCNISLSTPSFHLQTSYSLQAISTQWTQSTQKTLSSSSSSSSSLYMTTQINLLPSSHTKSKNFQRTSIQRSQSDYFQRTTNSPITHPPIPCRLLERISMDQMIPFIKCSSSRLHPVKPIYTIMQGDLSSSQLFSSSKVLTYPEIEIDLRNNEISLSFILPIITLVFLITMISLALSWRNIRKLIKKTFVKANENTIPTVHLGSMMTHSYCGPQLDDCRLDSIDDGDILNEVSQPKLLDSKRCQCFITLQGDKSSPSDVHLSEKRNSKGTLLSDTSSGYCSTCSSCRGSASSSGRSSKRSSSTPGSRSDSNSRPNTSYVESIDYGGLPNYISSTEV